MIDIKLLRQDPQGIEARLRTKVADASVSPVLALDHQIRELKTRVEQLKAKRNAASDEIGLRKRKGESTEELMREMATHADQIHSLDHALPALEIQFRDALAALPNLPQEDVPIAESAQANVELRSWGEKPAAAFALKNHMELNEIHKLFDFERGAKLAGSGWPVYCGMGARLEWALLQYMIDFHVRNGYMQWIPPVVVKEDILFASGQLPKFRGQQYELAGDGMFLIPTAEVALNGLYYDEILSEEQLPMKYIAYTPCFRREAGGAGAQERGLIRMHQFNKVEMFAFSTPAQSGALFEEMVRRAEMILEGLELHYRSMLLVTGDMSFAAARTIDVEVWLPGQGRYYEVSSISNCTDYQARRGNVRYREAGGKPQFVHTLNGSGLATSRLMVAILENNQQPDGSIVIPNVLRPYLGGIEQLPAQ